MSLMKIIKTVLIFLAVALLIWLQLGLVKSLPAPWSAVDLIFAALFFVTLLVDHRLGWWLALISGVWLELYSPLIFGGIFFPLLIMVAVINFLFSLIFTNRSWYSLIILSAVGLIIFDTLNFIYLFLAHWLNFTELRIYADSSFFAGIIWQLILTLSLLTLVYLPLRLWGKRFRSVFLVEGRR